MNAKRKEVEQLAYKIFDTLDPTGTNTDYWKKAFSNMSDTRFVEWLKSKFPYRFQVRPFEIEPDLAKSKKALDILGVPLTERVAEPFLYRNSKGEPIWTQPTFVGYNHLRKPKQFITKKNHMSMNIDQRDMKSGQLVSDDKGARQSDREFEAMQVMGLDYSTIEFAKIKGDSMLVKNQAYNNINLTGDVRITDLDIDRTDSLGRNMISAYMISSHLQTNMINQDYLLPMTTKNKKTRIERE